MVEISMFGSGEGLVWATGRGYSTGIIELGNYSAGYVGDIVGASVCRMDLFVKVNT
jgi:hypothetical protein